MLFIVDWNWADRGNYYQDMSLIFANVILLGEGQVLWIHCERIDAAKVVCLRWGYPTSSNRNGTYIQLMKFETWKLTFLSHLGMSHSCHIGIIYCGDTHSALFNGAKTNQSEWYTMPRCAVVGSLFEQDQMREKGPQKQNQKKIYLLIYSALMFSHWVPFEQDQIIRKVRKNNVDLFGFCQQFDWEIGHCKLPTRWQFAVNQ